MITMTPPPRDATHDATLKRFQAALAVTDVVGYQLTLYVSGASDLSARAIANARKLCDLHLAGRYQLSVVDLYDNPAAGVEASVLAAPTLVRNRPLPTRMIVGDLSHTARVLQALLLPLEPTPLDPRG
jgi:circadian clock protein KaiB